MPEKYERPAEVPQEWHETIRRLAYISDRLIPRFLSRGIDLSGVPAPLRSFVRGMMKSDRMRVLLPMALLTHPAEDRILTQEEARAWFQELIRMFTWAFSAMPGGLYESRPAQEPSGEGA